MCIKAKRVRATGVRSLRLSRRRLRRVGRQRKKVFSAPWFRRTVLSNLRWWCVASSPPLPFREAGGLTRLVQLTADAVAATAPPTTAAVGLAAAVAAGPSGAVPAAVVRPASPGAFDRRGTLLPAVQLLQVGRDDVLAGIGMHDPGTDKASGCRMLLQVRGIRMAVSSPTQSAASRCRTYLSGLCFPFRAHLREHLHCCQHVLLMSSLMCHGADPRSRQNPRRPCRP